MISNADIEKQLKDIDWLIEDLSKTRRILTRQISILRAREKRGMVVPKLKQYESDREAIRGKIAELYKQKARCNNTLSRRKESKYGGMFYASCETRKKYGMPVSKLPRKLRAEYYRERQRARRARLANDKTTTNKA